MCVCARALVCVCARTRAYACLYMRIWYYETEPQSATLANYKLTNCLLSTTGINKKCLIDSTPFGDTVWGVTEPLEKKALLEEVYDWWWALRISSSAPLSVLPLSFLCVDESVISQLPSPIVRAAKAP